MGTRGMQRRTATSAGVTRRWAAVLAVLAAFAFTAACGGDDDDATSEDTAGDDGGENITSEPSTDDGDDADENDDGADEADDPLVRLTYVTYNGNPSYEFEYDQSGGPVAHTVFHPVTGEPNSHFQVDAVDDEGNITEFSVEDLPDGTIAHETNTYDDQGRVLTQTFTSDTTEWTTTYAYDGSTVTMTADGGTTVYTLDDAGNITTSESTFTDPPATHTNLEFDDHPNPFTMTGGLLVQIWSTNNAVRWTPDAGCEYIEEFTYDGDLLVASHAEGCGFTHDYTYEYTEF